VVDRIRRFLSVIIGGILPVLGVFIAAGIGGVLIAVALAMVGYREPLPGGVGLLALLPGSAVVWPLCQVGFLRPVTSRLWPYLTRDADAIDPADDDA